MTPNTNEPSQDQHETARHPLSASDLGELDELVADSRAWLETIEAAIAGELGRGLMYRLLDALAAERAKTEELDGECQASMATIAEERARAEKAESRAEALEKERDALAKQVYVPGVRRCAKCGLRLISSVMDASSGRVAAKDDPEPCPNGCGPTWRVTEREAGNRLIDDQDALITRANRAEAEVAGLKARVAEVLEPFVVRVPRGALNGAKSDDAIVATTGQELGHFRRAAKLHADLVAQKDRP